MTKKILFADEESELLCFLKQYFESIGYETLTALTSRETIDMILNSKPDVAIISRWFVDGDRGLAVVKEVHEKAPSQKIIFLAPDSQQDDEAEKVGALFCLHKVCGIEEFEKAIETVIKESITS